MAATTCAVSWAENRSSSDRSSPSRPLSRHRCRGSGGSDRLPRTSATPGGSRSTRRPSGATAPDGTRCRSSITSTPGRSSLARSLTRDGTTSSSARGSSASSARASSPIPSPRCAQAAMTEVQKRALSASVTSQDSQAQDPAGRWWTHSANSTVLPAPAGAATSVTGWSRRGGRAPPRADHAAPSVLGAAGGTNLVTAIRGAASSIPVPPVPRLSLADHGPTEIILPRATTHHPRSGDRYYRRAVAAVDVARFGGCRAQCHRVGSVRSASGPRVMAARATRDDILGVCSPWRPSWRRSEKRGRAHGTREPREGAALIPRARHPRWVRRLARGESSTTNTASRSKYVVPLISRNRSNGVAVVSRRSRSWTASPWRCPPATGRSLRSSGPSRRSSNPERAPA